MSSSPIHYGATALLVMDFQRGVVSRQPGAPKAVERVSHAINHARSAAVPVVYVRVAFREGHPEVSARNRIFSRIVADGDFAESDETSQIVPALSPVQGDVVVTKRRVSAFTGSDLEVVLRAQGATTLVLTGISTSGVVLSTLREAADRDFNIIVLSDACTDVDSESHTLLLEKIFPRQATVMRVDEWVGGLPTRG
jgi:nicotinamidase-related amidase